VRPQPNSVALAASLARPVRCGWLSIEMADVVLVRAADRDPDVDDLLAAWRALQSTLRNALMEVSA